ncbi:Flp pilus assembly protein CpaB [Terricaulis silvestris]|uniref:Flp pilus assembly protein CpaB n=1 Tax=Terricaulis silvestris TaxID=2686094 RepID=A0A6I6MZQ1_9CAUL|nr:Flp pilus assembly protein CpaB [Terricaulis silvestris]QGZ96593.1 Flp pilus assembly protein CpaB [Terricaulis silvestris]
MRRLGLIVLAIAILLGGVATFGILNLQNARTAANNATRVVVADRAIALGQTLTPDMLRLQAWPAGATPPGAFTEIQQLTGETHVALRTIEPNEPVLASRISGAGGRATLSATIAEGHRAVAIRVNDVVGVAGFVLPGDSVDVLLTREEGQGNNSATMRTDLLIANVRVLAIDQSASESSNDPQVARAVTIEVTPEGGQKVALAGQIGTLTLALRRPDEIGQANRAPVTTIRIQDLRAEAERATLTTAPRPVRTRAASAPAGPSIEIIRGSTSNRASVTSE